MRDWISGDNAAYKPNTTITTADNAVIDAFGRQRVSDPVTLFDSQLTVNDQPLLWESAGAGTAAHVAAKSAVQLSVAGGESILRQSRQYIRYQPGKSQLILMTGVLGAATADITQRIGYYDDMNGIYFQQTSTGLAVVRRSSVSGTTVNTAVAQADWNIDTMDGNGASGITIDTTKAQIFFIDIEWLGVGRVRCAFVVDGKVYYCHQFLNTNTFDTIYMQSANLPLRYELISGSTGTASDMFQICSSVISEGGFEADRGIPHSVGHGSAGIASVQARRPVLSIEPVTTYNGTVNHGEIVPLDVSIYAVTNPVFWEVVYGGTISGGSFGSVGSNSIVEYDVAGTAISGGEVIASGYVAAAGNPQQAKAITEGALASKLPMATGYSGTVPIPLSVVCTGIGGAATVYASVTWRELY